MTFVLAIQLEFTHAIGPTPGLYVVQSGDPGQPAGSNVRLPHMGDVFGVTRTKGSADVMIITVVEAKPARRPLSTVLGSRRGVAVEPDDVRPVSILVVTYAFASQPFDDRTAARAAYDRLREDPERAVELVEHSLAALNRGIDAFRVAAEDPYVVEVAPEDPRAVRVVLASAEQVRQGNWTDGFTLTGARRSRPSRAARAAALRPSEAVAVALAEGVTTDPVELHLLRAQLDLEHHRIPSALAELSCALDLAKDDDHSIERDELAEALRALRAPRGTFTKDSAPSTAAPEDEAWTLLGDIRELRVELLKRQPGVSTPQDQHAGS